MLEVKMETLAKRGVNPYQAVKMTSKIARSINEKVQLGILQTTEKPTSIALKKLIEGRVVLAEEEGLAG